MRKFGLTKEGSSCASHVRMMATTIPWRDGSESKRRLQTTSFGGTPCPGLRQEPRDWGCGMVRAVSPHSHTGYSTAGLTAAGSH